MPQHFYDPRLVPQVATSIALLASLAPSPLDSLLQIRSLRDFAEEFIIGKVYSAFFANLRDRKRKGLSHQHPRTLLRLHNSAVDHMQKVFKREQLQQVSWPMNELREQAEEALPSYWNDPAYLDTVVKALDSLRFPDRMPGDTDILQPWSEQAATVWNYFKGIRRFGDDDEAAKCTSTLRRVLLKSHRAQERKDPWDPTTLMPWTDIVSAFVALRLRPMECRDMFSADCDDMTVACFASDIDLFVPAKEWRHKLGWKPEQEESIFIQSTIHKASLSYMSEHSTRDGPSILDKSTDLKNTISEESVASAKFEEKLKSAIPGSSLPIRATKVTTSTPSAVEQRPHESSSFYRYVPVAVMLSPSLARLCTSRDQHIRMRRMEEEEEEEANQNRSPNEEESTLKRRMLSGPPSGSGRKVMRRASEKIGDHVTVAKLRERIDDDLDASFAFEQRLKAAMGK